MEWNLTEEHVRQKLVAPYLGRKPFLFAGFLVNPLDIVEFMIFESKLDFRDLILPNGKHANEEDDARYIMRCFATKRVKGVNWSTYHFVTLPSKEREETRARIHRSIEAGEKWKVFIVHGRDETQALRLQKYLTQTLKIDTHMFEDFKEKSGSNTIIEQLEYIKDNVGYAFVIVTPDDLGCLREEIDKCRTKMLIGKENIKVESVCKILGNFNTRTRQNVVFEHGLFIGALGRHNVCCLFQEDTKEKPSDIDGILYVGFNKSVKETFPKITEKLKNAGLVKT